MTHSLAPYIKLRWLRLGMVILLLAGPAGARAADEIQVRLKSGRWFSGYVDARTDHERLWLRTDAAGMEVRRPIAWERIVEATVDGRRLDASELRQQAGRLQSPSRAKTLRIAARNEDALEEQAVKSPRGQSGHIPVEASTPPARPICSVDFDARIANWDGDVEPDGLLIDLYPLDAGFQMTPVDGFLTVELIVPQRRAYDEVPRGRGQRFSAIGRWSRVVRPEDLTARGITVKLPFQAAHPSFDDDVGRYGLVHVRLVVPGRGVFEGSRDGVPTRRVFTPNRDALLPSATGRYFSWERSGRGRRSSSR